MKLKPSLRPLDPRAFPLDGTDSFLLSRLQDEMSLEELCDMMPCPSDETVERVDKLIAAGLLQSSSEATAAADFHDDQLPDLEAPAFDDPELHLDADDWEDLLPFPADDGLPYPVPEPAVELLHVGLRDADDSAFAVDPPSTLISLFKRGPLCVEINTVEPPRSHAGMVSDGSKLFRRPAARADEPATIETSAGPDPVGKR